MSIPLNLEHVEAAQADINAKRQAMKAAMTSTEVARLEVIEECSAKLEAAGVPFQLWAASDDGKEDDGTRKGWWCFHKLSYASQDDIKVYNSRVFEAWQWLVVRILDHQTTHGNVVITVHDATTGNAYSVHRLGQHQFVPPPAPDLPACDCQPPTV